jgi:hypothetical protein
VLGNVGGSGEGHERLLIEQLRSLEDARLEQDFRLEARSYAVVSLRLCGRLCRETSGLPLPPPPGYALLVSRS